MNTYNLPVYTEYAECQDCYKCVRECPVKAIKIEDFHASIIPELCLQCGHCVSICPAKAKQVRNDLTRVKTWLTLGNEVIVSLAPSWQSEYPKFSEQEIVMALKRCGFSAVSETALGAEEINAHLISFLPTHSGLWFSTACPVVTQLILKYYPQFKEHLVPFTSPMVAHAHLLRKEISQDAKVVFIGPCFAKKGEADAVPQLIDAAITFQDMDKLFTESPLVAAIDATTCTFVPRSAQEGRRYPVDGGMISGIRQHSSPVDASTIAISGMKNIIAGLQELHPEELEGTVFIEMMACAGGCINGPGIVRHISSLQKRIDLLHSLPIAVTTTQTLPKYDTEASHHVTALTPFIPTESDIIEVFHSIGKYRPKDQLNCGGCGYDSCRDFATAVLAGKAERGMCVNYLRLLAQKKANALFRSMPSGAVIIDAKMQVVQMNNNFARLIHLDEQFDFIDQDFTGAHLSKLLPFSRLFEQVLQSGEDIEEQQIHLRDTILKVSIFIIEPHQLLGCILQDITKPSVAREQTVRQAREVIHKNLDMVQKIAYLLGENAAEVEMTLNSIIDVTGQTKSMTPEKEEE